MPGATAFVALRVAPGHPWPVRHKGIHAQIRAPRIFSTLDTLATIRGEKCGLRQFRDGTDNKNVGRSRRHLLKRFHNRCRVGQARFARRNPPVMPSGTRKNSYVPRTPGGLRKKR